MKLNFIDQGAGPVVILLHGMFGSLSNLGNLARRLAANYRVICVDLRNHGDSPHDSAMDIPLMALDIVELVNDLGLDQAHLIGHSLGGKLAMQVALNQPQLVASLVVADIAPVSYPQSNSLVVDSLQALDSQTVASRAEADRILAAYIEDAPTRAFILKNLQRNTAGDLQLKLNVDSIIANYGTKLVQAPTGDPFSGPTLFIKGELSAYIQDRHRDMIKQLFPQSELEIIEGAGHWLHAEKPESFNNLVNNFLVANG
jgi:esterase